MKNIQETFQLIKQNTVQITPEDAFLKKLEKKEKLIIKLGMDPTAPDLHLGHTIVLSKLREFQDLGHTIVFLIGDFTTRIGDPSGRSKTRPPLTIAEIEYNMKTYFDQVGKVLDTTKAVIRYNSEWLSALTFVDIIQLCGKVTVARIIEREDFAQRLAQKEPIGLHELLYPLMQGYDSIALRADVELGGTDQTFNLLMGRTLQEQYGQEPQVIITTPLLEGLDGVQKMSKSLGNYVSLNDSAQNAYGKLMSISDTLMWRYLALLLYKTEHKIVQLQTAVSAETLHPMTLKKEMAHDIVARFWPPDEAAHAATAFEALFQKKDYAQADAISIDPATPNPLWIVELLKLLGAISSSSEAKRLIESGAVHIDGYDTIVFKSEIAWHSGMVIKVGKHRIYRIN